MEIVASLPFSEPLFLSQTDLLRGDVDELQLRVRRVALSVDRRDFCRRSIAGERGTGNSQGAELLSLIENQRAERRDDESDAVVEHRGQLIAERFAPAGGHEHEKMKTSFHGAVDRFLLVRTESSQSEERVKAFEHRLRVRELLLPVLGPVVVDIARDPRRLLGLFFLVDRRQILLLFLLLLVEGLMFFRTRAGLIEGPVVEEGLFKARSGINDQFPLTKKTSRALDHRAFEALETGGVSAGVGHGSMNAGNIEFHLAERTDGDRGSDGDGRRLFLRGNHWTTGGRLSWNRSKDQSEQRKRVTVREKKKRAVVRCSRWTVVARSLVILFISIGIVDL